MGRCVVVAYRPKPDRHDQLLTAVRKHISVLRAEQLVTDRPAVVMQASDGTILEVFEWRSADAIQTAHGNSAVQALWAEFGAACDYVPLNTLHETSQLFAEFETIDL